MISSPHASAATRSTSRRARFKNHISTAPVASHASFLRRDPVSVKAMNPPTTAKPTMPFMPTQVGAMSAVNRCGPRPISTSEPDPSRYWPKIGSRDLRANSTDEVVA
jgi:hypothetical protein